MTGVQTCALPIFGARFNCLVHGGNLASQQMAGIAICAVFSLGVYSKRVADKYNLSKSLAIPLLLGL